MMRFGKRAAAVVAAALLLAGCGPDGGSGRSSAAEPGRPDPSAPTAAPAPGHSAGAVPTDALPRPLTGQRLRWARCTGGAGAPPGGQWQCATMKAPLDYTRPGGRTIGIALIREKSTGSGSRIGSLVFNFGGPGGSGVSLLPSFADLYGTLRGRYDLVSFDPRGVGASEGVRCRSDQQLQAAESVDLTPDTAAEEKAYFKDAADFGAGCERSAGSLLPHLSTADTARDMDLLREVLGDRRLHYFGISYGTELGGVYAHLFPKNTGRLVLDAVVDPTANSTAQEKNQTRGFQRALDDYLTSTGQDPRRGTARIAALLKRLDARPLPASGDRKLTQSLAVTGITVTLYSKETWPELTAGLQAAGRGDGSPLLRLADAYNERGPSGHYGTQAHAQRAISCRDSKQRPTPEQARRELGAFRAISPVFGPLLGWDSAGWCYQWPVPGLDETPDVAAAGAPPILVVGNTGDPATPYEGARKMADELGRGVGIELTWKGEGHGAYGNGSGCVDGTVDDYLLDGTTPRDGKVCS
ncbi:peptidase [Streptomyces sulfonofaciens]|uniref:Peptidase n=1 Tax=Streptomyces sulfonofaciens TaxID=68272 RepID=A0A919L3P7_9ACTN|nr:alpha/beta hydrolase [Streptomyces sulfonofaciens]GHH81551.1 peptidase [Streptomyces sulfonofaciens]